MTHNYRIRLKKLGKRLVEAPERLAAFCCYSLSHRSAIPKCFQLALLEISQQTPKSVR